MLVEFYQHLKAARLPVSVTEYLALMEAMSRGVADYDLDRFYYVSRALLVKDERYLDRFDRVFDAYFSGRVDAFSALAGEIPDEWLRRQAELLLSDEEKAAIEAGGGFEELMKTLAERLAEQRERHEGGSKWIGTAGRSPFGAYGYHPEGVRFGQDGGRNRRAVKVWERREFADLDDGVELGTRNLKVALRKLRRFAREGAREELDLDGTISATARNAGWLDVKLVAERHNAVKVLLFIDVGGSMYPFVQTCEQLFSAARSEFRHLEHFYFHNFFYDFVWRDNRRRHDQTTPLEQLMRTYGSDYKVIVVGDASMSPYEITTAGGSVEYFNAEPGEAFARRMLAHWPRAAWLNPVPREGWAQTRSIGLVRELFEDRMFPLTVHGIEAAIDCLKG